jgi:hypothetical protein
MQLGETLECFHKTVAGGAMLFAVIPRLDFMQKRR